MCVRVASLLTVLIYPYISGIVLQKCGVVVGSTHRIVTGQIIIIISKVFGLLTTGVCYDYNLQVLLPVIEVRPMKLMAVLWDIPTFPLARSSHSYPWIP